MLLHTFSTLRKLVFEGKYQFGLGFVSITPRVSAPYFAAEDTNSATIYGSALAT